MGKILIITQDGANSKRGDILYFTKYANKSNYDIHLMSLDNFSIVIENNESPVFYFKNEIIDFKNYNSVMFRTIGKYKNMAHMIAQHLDSHNIYFTDKLILKMNLLDKANQMFKLNQKGLCIPKTMAMSSYNKDLILENFELPFVLKAASSSRGRSVYLIKTIEELDQNQNLINSDDYIIQAMIPNTFDYRITVSGHKGSVISKRVRQEDEEFLNNACKGAQEIFSNPDENKTHYRLMVEAGIEASDILNIDNSGIDIIMHSNKPYIIEVNRAPQLTIDQNIELDEKIFAKAIIQNLILKGKPL